MIRKSIICFIVLSWFIGAQGESELTPKQVIDRLKSSSTQDGIKVGLIIDPHKSDSINDVYAAIITLPAGSNYTAYDVLLKSGISMVKHPQFKTPPKVLILSLMGIPPDTTSDGNRTWTFFVLENSKWILPKKPDDEILASVSEAPVSDGSIIGFSRTTWVRINQNEFKPKYEPRIGK